MFYKKIIENIKINVRIYLIIKEKIVYRKIKDNN